MPKKNGNHRPQAKPKAPVKAAKKPADKKEAPKKKKSKGWFGALKSAASSVATAIFGGGKKDDKAGNKKGADAKAAAPAKKIDNPPEPTKALEPTLDSQSNQMFAKLTTLFHEFRPVVKIIVKAELMKQIVAFLNCLRLKQPGELLAKTLIGFTKNYELMVRNSMQADITIISEMLCHWQILQLFDSHMVKAKEAKTDEEKWEFYSKAIAKLIRSLQYS